MLIPRRYNLRTHPLALLVCHAFAALAASAANAETRGESATRFELQLRSGQVLSGSLQSITNTGVQLTERPISWSELRSLRQLSASWRRPSGGAVWLGCCDVLFGQIEDFTGEEIRVRRQGLTSTSDASGDAVSVVIPTELATACFPQLPHSEDTRREDFLSLSRPHQNADEAWLHSGDRFTGEFQSIADGKVGWNLPTGEPTQFPQRDLRVVRFNPQLVSIPALPKRTWHVALSDGSRLTVVSWETRNAPEATTGQPSTPIVALKLAGGPEIMTSVANIHHIVCVDEGDRPLRRVDLNSLRWQSELGGEYTVAEPDQMDRLPVDVVTSGLTPVGSIPLVSVRAEALVLSQRGESVLRFVVAPGERSCELLPALDDASALDALAEVHVDGKLVAEWTLSLENPIGRMTRIPLSGHSRFELHTRRSLKPGKPIGQVVVNWLDPIVGK